MATVIDGNPSTTLANLGGVTSNTPNFTGQIIANNSIELGPQDGTVFTPYIDFHTGATVVDFDARLIANSSTGVAAAGYSFNGSLTYSI